MKASSLPSVSTESTVETAPDAPVFALEGGGGVVAAAADDANRSGINDVASAPVASVAAVAAAAAAAGVAGATTGVSASAPAAVAASAGKDVAEGEGVGEAVGAGDGGTDGQRDMEAVVHEAEEMKDGGGVTVIVRAVTAEDEQEVVVG